jgi:hypothetical protein
MRALLVTGRAGFAGFANVDERANSHDLWTTAEGDHGAATRVGLLYLLKITVAGDGRRRFSYC